MKIIIIIQKEFELKNRKTIKYVSKLDKILYEVRERERERRLEREREKKNKRKENKKSLK